MFHMFLRRYVSRGKLDWKVSSYSNPGGIISTCVAVATTPDKVFVKNSNDPTNKTVEFTHEEWTKFIQGVNAGEFSL